MKKRTKTIVKWLVGVLLLALGAGWGVMTAVKHAWIPYNEHDIRTEGMLRVGDLAPDIELTSLKGGETQRISDLYCDKPLVLVFGSYT